MVNRLFARKSASLTLKASSAACVLRKGCGLLSAALCITQHSSQAMKETKVMQGLGIRLENVITTGTEEFQQQQSDDRCCYEHTTTDGPQSQLTIVASPLECCD